MGTLGTGKRQGNNGKRGFPGLHLDLHALVAKQLDAGTSMNPSTPVMPLEGGGTDSHWMQEDAHLARLLGGGAIPLTLLARASQGRQPSMLAA